MLMKKSAHARAFKSPTHKQRSAQNRPKKSRPAKSWKAPDSSVVADSIDYLLVYLLISLSGNMAFGMPVMFGTLFFAIVMFVYRRRQLDIIFITLLVSLFIILMLQSMKFDYFAWFTMAGAFVRILLAFFVVKSVGSKFIERYSDIMVGLSLVSIVFYLAVHLVPGLHAR